MSFKRFTIVIALLAVLTAAVSADDEPGPKGHAIAGYWHSGPSVLLADPIVQEATGLDGEDLRAALQDGSSISELIAANDGDVESVIAALVAQASESIKTRAAVSIEGLEASFTEAMDESHRPRFPWLRRRNPVREHFGGWGMVDTIAQATGLDLAALNAALLQGATIAELINANDGDVAATVSTLVEQATAGINEAAATRIQHYEEAVVEAFEADFSDRSRRWRKWRPRRGAFFSFRGVYESSGPTADNSKQETTTLAQPEEED